MSLNEVIQKKMKMWTENEYFDVQSRKELLAIKDPQEIEDCFYRDIEFGTGGMRGILGVGTNRINRYTIRKVSQGLADAISEHGQAARERGVVIAFDCRRYSEEFALETALVLAANHITVYLFDSLSPTPELSFAVRYLHAVAGVNITASHNPKEYNGYKLYWEDGAQLTPEHSNKIVEKIAERESWEITPLEESEARAAGLLYTIGKEVDMAYEKEILQSLFVFDLTQAKGENIKIVFTPLHGTGGRPVPRVLHKMGFTSLWVVPEQEKPDPEFTTVKFPNPEEPEAYVLALKLAKKHKADLILATDPDADRLGAYARNTQGEYSRFTGNQIGVILEYYILSQLKRLGRLPKNAVVVKTVASTDLGDAVAADFGVRTVNVLVGFKYIGEQIKRLERDGSGTYVFGFEESHGYLAGTYTRDKDAVQAAALLAEAALYYQEKEKKSLPEVLKEIFQRYGTYLDEQVAVVLSGKEGRERIAAVMGRLRKMNPALLGGMQVEQIDDFLSGIRSFVQVEKQEKIDLPQENALRFSFTGGGFVMARPSGTEPKIRFYFCIKGHTAEEAGQALVRVKDEFFDFLKDLIER